MPATAQGASGPSSAMPPQAGGGPTSPAWWCAKKASTPISFCRVGKCAREPLVSKTGLRKAHYAHRGSRKGRLRLPPTPRAAWRGAVRLRPHQPGPARLASCARGALEAARRQVAACTPPGPARTRPRECAQDALCRGAPYPAASTPALRPRLAARRLRAPALAPPPSPASRASHGTSCARPRRGTRSARARAPRAIRAPRVRNRATPALYTQPAPPPLAPPRPPPAALAWKYMMTPCEEPRCLLGMRLTPRTATNVCTSCNFPQR